MVWHAETAGNMLAHETITVFTSRSLGVEAVAQDLISLFSTTPLQTSFLSKCTSQSPDVDVYFESVIERVAGDSYLSENTLLHALRRVCKDAQNVLILDSILTATGVIKVPNVGQREDSRAY